MWRKNPVVDVKIEKQNGDEELGRGERDTGPGTGQDR